MVKETDLSDYQRSKKLHTLPSLGNQCPSELLVSIRNLQPIQDCKCYCARYQFLSRMPPIMRAQLVNQKDLTVDELAALVDTIMLSQASLHNVLTEIQADQHNEQVFNLWRPPLATSTASALKSSTPQQSSKGKKKKKICWFHGKFGKNATSCRPPCSMAGNGQWGSSRD